MARENDAPALHIVSEDGGERKLSFKEMSQRSAQVANHLAIAGRAARRPSAADAGQRAPFVGGDAGLHEARRGAHSRHRTVTTEDLRDRIERGQVRHVLAAERTGAEVRRVGGRLHPCGDRGRRARLAVLSGCRTRVVRLLPTATRGPTTRCCSTSLRAPRPSRSWCSTLIKLSGGPSLHHVLDRPRAGRRAPEHLVAGLGQACVELLLRTVECGRLCVHPQHARFNAKALLEVLATHGVTSLCAPPTVWRMLIQEDLAAWRGACNCARW